MEHQYMRLYLLNNLTHHCTHNLFAVFSIILLLNLIAHSEEYNDISSFYKKAGFTSLIGNVQGTLKAQPYIVEDSIVIKSATVLSIESGALLVFVPNAKMIIDGHLICRGSPSAPIIFTNSSEIQIKHLLHTENSEWYGIILRDSAKMDLRYCHVRNSKKGVTVINKDCSVMCDNVTLENNVQSFSYCDSVLPVIEGKPFTLTFNGDKPVLDLAIKVNNGFEENSTHRRSGIHLFDPQYRNLRIGLTVSAGVGAFAAISGWIVNSIYYDKYTSADDWYKDSKDMVTRYEKYAKASKIIGIAGVGISTASIGAFSLTFLF